MAQIWSTGPAHIFVGVAQKRVSTPAPPPLQRSLSEIFADQGGGVKEAVVRGGLPPRNDDPFNFRGVGAGQAPSGPPGNPFGAISQVDVVPRSRQPEFLTKPPRDVGPHPTFLTKEPRKPAVASPQPAPAAPPTMVRVPQYLGTAEKAPFIDIEEASEPWFTDEGGPVNHTDEMFVGTSGTVTLLTTRFSQATLDRLLSRPNPVTGTAGRNSVRDFGELAGLERGGFPLYIMFPNFGLSAYASPGEVMPGGYRFWFAKLLSSQIVPGTQAQKVAMRFSVRQAWQITRHSRPEAHAAVEKGATEAVLFDYDLSGVNGVGGVGVS